MAKILLGLIRNDSLIFSMGTNNQSLSYFYSSCMPELHLKKSLPIPTYDFEKHYETFISKVAASRTAQKAMLQFLHLRVHMKGLHFVTQPAFWVSVCSAGDAVSREATPNPEWAQEHRHNPATSRKACREAVPPALL